MFRDYYFISGFIISIVIIAIAGTMSWVFFSDWEAQALILHWDIYRGTDVFGSPQSVVGIFIIATVALLLNFILASYLYNRERFLAYLFSFSSIVFSILVLIAAGAIIYFN